LRRQTTVSFCLSNIAGDFAVLLRSGMTVKQAITYNMVSSVLAFAGMCLGVVVGTLHGNASSWVFALTAGIFIYVSLVDMVSLTIYSAKTIIVPCTIII